LLITYPTDLTYAAGTCTGTSGFFFSSIAVCDAPANNVIKLRKDMFANKSSYEINLGTFTHPLKVMTVPSFIINMYQSDGSKVAEITGGLSYDTIAGAIAIADPL
jgi:hypothetical protein